MEPLVIVGGAVVALVVQILKKYLGTNTIGTLGAVLILSLIGGFVYNYLVVAGYWENVLGILSYSGAIYTFIIRRFESE